MYMYNMSVGMNHTVNSEIFATVLFLRNFADADFRENKTLAKTPCPLLMFVNHAKVANFLLMYFTTVCENKILAKISKFKVSVPLLSDLVTKKPVFVISDQIRFKLVCSDSETS